MRRQLGCRAAALLATPRSGLRYVRSSSTTNPSREQQHDPKRQQFPERFQSSRSSEFSSSGGAAPMADDRSGWTRVPDTSTSSSQERPQPTQSSSQQPPPRQSAFSRGSESLNQQRGFQGGGQQGGPQAGGYKGVVPLKHRQAQEQQQQQQAPPRSAAPAGGNTEGYQGKLPPQHVAREAKNLAAVEERKRKQAEHVAGQGARQGGTDGRRSKGSRFGPNKEKFKKMSEGGLKKHVLDAARRSATSAVVELRLSQSRTITVARLSSTLNVGNEAIREALQSLGEENVPKRAVTRKKDEFGKFAIDGDIAELIALELNRTVKVTTATSFGSEDETSDNETVAQRLRAEAAEMAEALRPKRPEPDSAEWASLPLRPPVVAVMGHVDHGKTTLLDALRGAKTADKEAGGITQRLSAFESVTDDKKVTFMDTPGHAAFAAMRSSSARALDIALVVVAADDGIKPQTKEALELARERRAAVVFALTKVDKFNGNKEELRKARERISGDLNGLGFATEEQGGECPMVEVAANQGLGLKELRETLAALSEVLDLRAATGKGLARGTVVDTVHDKHFGPCADVLVTWGTLQVGDFVVVGECAGKIRRLGFATTSEDEKPEAKDTTTKKKKKNKEPVRKEAAPATPCRVAGLEVCKDGKIFAAGDEMLWCKDLKTASALAEKRARAREASVLQSQARYARKVARLASELRQKEIQLKQQGPSAVEEEIVEEVKEALAVSVLLKVASDGEMEAVRMLLNTFPSTKAKLEVVSGIGVGPVGTSDIDMAAVFGAPVFAWNVGMNPTVREIARRKDVDIRRHDIIYSLIDDIKTHLVAKLPPVQTLETTGRAEVAMLITLSKGELIAGCQIVEGEINCKHAVRIVRNGDVLYYDTRGLKSLKHFKEDVPKLEKGKECGMGLFKHDDFEIVAGDVIETVKIVETPGTLEETTTTTTTKN